MKIPTTSDFIFSWGTFHGFKSFRRPNHGSYYIQTLCQILDTYGFKHDLISNLTLVASVVAQEFEMGGPEIGYGKKQMPCLDSTLTRLLFFHPKSQPGSQSRKTSDINYGRPLSW